MFSELVVGIRVIFLFFSFLKFKNLKIRIPRRIAARLLKVQPRIYLGELLEAVGVPFIHSF